MKVAQKGILSDAGMTGGSILVTLRDLEDEARMGGIGTYYKALQPHLSPLGRYFTIGRRKGMTGFLSGVLQLGRDYRRLWAEAGATASDMVHVNPSLSRNCLVRDGISLTIARARGRKVLVFFRGWDEKVEKKIDREWRWFFQRTFGRVRGAIVLSQRFAGKLREWGYAGPIFVETTTVDDRLANNRLVRSEKREATDATVRLLFLARAERDKGLLSVIEAFSRVQRVWPARIELLVAGEGKGKVEAEAYVRDRRIAGVHFLGYVSGSRKAAVYQEADLYVFPSSHGEGMPNSVLEAMAFGLPVITTPVGGLADFFEEGKMGLLLESTSEECISAAILKLLKDPELRMRMGEYSADFAKKNFLARAVAKRLEAIWTAVSTGTAPAGMTFSWLQRDEGLLQAREWTDRGEKSAEGRPGEACHRLREYVERENFSGYDPYDALNGWIPFGLGGKWVQVVYTQIHKRNPINLRPLMGIAKERNPKGIGLFLSAYSRLACQGDVAAETIAGELFSWLLANQSSGYGGSCWGYNFDWVNPLKTVKAGVPSVVVTAFIAKGIYQYFQLTRDERARQTVLSCCDYVLKTLPRTETDQGVCFSYTHLKRDCVFNANMLAAEILAMGAVLGECPEFAAWAKRAIDFTLAYQKKDGRWSYSRDWETGLERAQIDFHQGFVLDSIDGVVNLLGLNDRAYEGALRRGARFFLEEQFRPEGRCQWRLPREWPVEIHNQAQGILTFTRLQRLDPGYLPFAQRIAAWTIEHMQDRSGYFYYQKFPALMNRIPYMRWAQAWMFLALVELIQAEEIPGETAERSPAEIGSGDAR